MNSTDLKRLADLEARVSPPEAAKEAEEEEMRRQYLDALGVNSLDELSPDDCVFLAELLSAVLGPEYWAHP